MEARGDSVSSVGGTVKLTKIREVDRHGIKISEISCSLQSVSLSNIKSAKIPDQPERRYRIVRETRGSFGIQNRLFGEEPNLRETPPEKAPGQADCWRGGQKRRTPSR